MPTTIRQIYDAVAAGGDKSAFSEYGVGQKRWLGKAYAENTVLKGATKFTDVHTKNGDTEEGFSVNGGDTTAFLETVNQYDLGPDRAAVNQAYANAFSAEGSRLDDGFPGVPQNTYISRFQGTGDDVSDNDNNASTPDTALGF